MSAPGDRYLRAERPSVNTRMHARPPVRSLSSGSPLRYLLICIALALLAIGAGLTAPAAAHAESAPASSAIKFAPVPDASQVVFDLETADLTPAELVLAVDDTTLNTHASPFGISAITSASAQAKTAKVSGPEGLDLRVIATFVDAEGTVLAHAAQSVTLTVTDDEPPIEVDPDPVEPPGDSSTNPDADASDRGDGSDRDGTMALTGSGLALWAIILAVLALVGGTIAVIIARKKATP